MDTLGIWRDGLILLPALALSALLVVSHTYLGLHVLARGIIFVDLALAQVAALGATAALMLGFDVHGLEGGAFAFAASLVAALGFSRLRQVPSTTAREAIIGAVYVVATALTVVVLSRSGPSLEELKALMNGVILWTRWTEVGVVAAVYGALALLHGVFRHRFLALSTIEGGTTWRPQLWEFLFFASFAVAITFAVSLAGVLMVFAFLIIPAFSASLLVRGFGAQLVLGWALGFAGTVAGLTLSYALDLPTGAAVVAVLGLLPVLAALARRGGRP